MELVVYRIQTRDRPSPVTSVQLATLAQEVENAKARLRLARLYCDDLSAEVAFETERVRRAVAALARAS